MKTTTIELFRNDIQRDIVSCESIKDTLSVLFPRLVNSVKVAFSGGSLADVNSVIPLDKDQHKFLAFINKFTYSDLMDITINTPSGFKTDYLTYLNLLEKVTESISDNLMDNLKKYSQLLGLLLSSQDEFKSSKSEVNKFLALEKLRDDLNSTLTVCFSSEKNTSTKTYGDLVKRNKDWEAIFKSLNKVINDVNSIDRNELSKASKSICYQLDLIEKLVESNQFDDMSRQMLASITEGGYQIAKDLEFFTVVYYRVEAIRSAIESSQDRLLTILKK